MKFIPSGARRAGLTFCVVALVCFVGTARSGASAPRKCSSHAVGHKTVVSCRRAAVTKRRPKSGGTEAATPVGGTPTTKSSSVQRSIAMSGSASVATTSEPGISTARPEVATPPVTPPPSPAPTTKPPSTTTVRCLCGADPAPYGLGPRGTKTTPPRLFKSPFDT